MPVIKEEDVPATGERFAPGLRPLQSGTFFKEPSSRVVS